MKSLDAPFDICWDEIGIPHIFATTTADAFRGMGYAEGSERLWQIHLSNLVATGDAASVLGPRFVVQDLLHRVFNVAAFDLPDSEGDWITDAYLEGLNAYVSELDEIPPEFKRAKTEPRQYTRHDIASRYRFTGWFQHKSWMNKIYLGKLMARHGVEQFRNIVHRFSDDDAAAVEELKEALLDLDPRVCKLLFPNVNIASGSNNWAVRSQLSQSGSGMMAMDPHQPHTIPNGFFYSHLNAPDLDVFGASFPGVPYYMMGKNHHLTWGLTTGFIDTYDVYVEKNNNNSEKQSFDIAVAGESSRRFDIAVSEHGPILESISDAVGITEPRDRTYITALYWAMRDLPTSSGVLAQMPLAKSSQELGEYLFENDVSPLVNNIICLDRDDDLRRFIATTLPIREGVTGSVPLPGWSPDRFKMTKAEDLLVEHNPAHGFALTANNDTMGQDFFPIHTFPAHHARSSRIRELLTSHSGKFSPSDFEEMQLDLLDIRARETVPHIIACLTEQSSEIQLAKELLSAWDFRADTSSKAASIYYPFLDKLWPIQFLHRVLKDDLVLSIADVAPTLSAFELSAFTAPGSPWQKYRTELNETICSTVRGVVKSIVEEFGEICSFGELQQISFRHSLSKYPDWSHMKLGPDPLGGSGTTLAMAMHAVKKKTAGASEKITVEHGPVFRWIVDLADPRHLRFVTSNGNGGRVDSPFIGDHYTHWLEGDYYDLSLVRKEIKVVKQDSIT